MKINKQQSLLLRSFDGDLDEQEQNLLDALLVSSDAARAELNELGALREAVAGRPRTTFSEGFANRVSATVFGDMAATNTSDDTNPVARIYTMNGGQMLRMAAMILLLVGISTIVWMQPRTYTAPLGTSVSRILPDGSTVLLSGGATMSYKPFWGRAERRVVLAGEAFFDVTKGSKAFIVETFNSQVRVLGTRFNVRAWPDQHTSYTSVVLEEGRIEVTPASSPNEKQVLLPDEWTIVSHDTTFPKKALAIPIETRLAWRSGGFAFDDELLEDVIADLSRRYNVHLSLAGNLGHQRITYFQPNHTAIDTVLTDIGRPHALSYRKTANGYELFAP